MPKDEQNALTDEWALFVKQKSLLGTTLKNFIDPRFTEAYSDLRSLIQLAVDLEARHDQHHTLDKKPPIFLTFVLSGIVDEPADSEEIKYVTQEQSLDLTPPVDFNHHSPSPSFEDLHTAQGASGRTYNTVASPSSSQGERTSRSPAHSGGGSGPFGRGGNRSFGGNGGNRGRSPTPRGTPWSQQSSYYENTESRSGGGG